MSSLPFDQTAPVLLLDVLLQMNGIQKKVRMALDTGATNVLITLEVAEALNVISSPITERAEVVTASGIEKVPVFYLDRVKVMDKEADHIKAVIHYLPEKGYVDGLLGLSFLRHFDLRINFREGILELN